MVDAARFKHRFGGREAEQLLFGAALERNRLVVSEK
jgi:hypothetical protein